VARRLGAVGDDLQGQERFGAAEIRAPLQDLQAQFQAHDLRGAAFPGCPE